MKAILEKLRLNVSRIGRYPFHHESRGSDQTIMDLCSWEKHFLQAGYSQEALDGKLANPFWKEPVWFIILCIDSIRAWLENCLQHCRRNRDFFGDFKKMVSLGRKYNLAPFLYFQYRLYRHRDKEYASRLIPSWAFGMLCRLDARLNHWDVGMLDNKERFEKFCRENKLPVPKSYDLSDLNRLSEVPERDLFIKPTNAYGGRQAMILVWNRVENKWLLDEKYVSRGDLESCLRERFGNQSLIVQPRLKNHPRIAKLGGGNALSTVRVLTIKERGKARPLRATLRIGSGMSIVDNLSQGGYAVAVNLETGELEDCYHKNEKNLLTRHPESGKRIKGCQLPFWEEAMKTVVRAHELAEGFLFLAWDVAILQECPILLECNVWPEVGAIQLPQDEPLGDDRFINAVKNHFFNTSGVSKIQS